MGFIFRISNFRSEILDGLPIRAFAADGSWSGISVLRFVHSRRHSSFANFASPLRCLRLNSVRTQSTPGETRKATDQVVPARDARSWPRVRPSRPPPWERGRKTDRWSSVRSDRGICRRQAASREFIFRPKPRLKRRGYAKPLSAASRLRGMIFCPDPRHKCRGNSRVRDDRVLQTFGS